MVKQAKARNMDLSVTESAGVVVARLSGRMDITSAEGVEATIRETIEKEPRPLVLNLAGVTYMSSSGVGALLGLYRLLDRAGLPMALAEVSPTVTKLLDVVEIAHIFSIHDVESSAVQAMAAV